MDKIVKLAIEGGYQKIPLDGKLLGRTKIEHNTFYFLTRKKYQREKEHSLTVWKGISINIILIDPLFWQALGKSLGWTNKSRLYWLYMHIDKPTQIKERWENEMHSFLDHLIASKSAESFFEELLK